MGKRFLVIMLCLGTMVVGTALFLMDLGKAEKTVFHAVETKKSALAAHVLPEVMPRFEYDAGFDFVYPKAVRGIYVTAHSAGGSRMEELIRFVDRTELNAMVIDIKDDYGHVTYIPDQKNVPFYDAAQPYIKNPKKLLRRLEKHGIYPIARIVVFKDSVLAHKHPEYSFRKNGKVWTNGNGDAFVNPFLQEVWEYNVAVAIAAAKMGFQEIQFDYVRFPEGFEHRDEILTYDAGKYGDLAKKRVEQRVTAVTDFVAYAAKKLQPYDVDVSVDIFGYTATIPAAPGIGQNFIKIARHVDVISAMIYPSHWTSYFGIRYPDLHPYELVSHYVRHEKQKLQQLSDPPRSRPWIQDFTATWLSHYQPYGIEEVEAQIRALNENGIKEFLLWNAGNDYTRGVDYTPLADEK